MADTRAPETRQRAGVERPRLMLSEARGYMEIAPHAAIFPGLAISLTILGFNLLGDGLRDVFDPRQYET